MSLRTHSPYDIPTEQLALCVSVTARLVTALWMLSTWGTPNALAVPPITNENAQLLASDAAANDLLGRSASLDGDIAAFGAPGENNVQGAVYVFGRNQGGANNWGQVRKVVATDGASNDEFGQSASIDGSILLVGARLDDDSGSGSGSAYIFYENQGGSDNWGQVKKLTASDAAANDTFGDVVDLGGNIAAVSALGESSHAGAVYLFERNQGGTDNWGQIKKLVASDAAGNDHFGCSVDINGDWLIVGAQDNDDGASSAGSAYIFYKDQGGTNNWGEVKKLTASDPGLNDFFGKGVAIDGDVAVVGGDSASGGLSAPGAVYVFHKNQGGANNWGQVKKATASDGQNGDDLGGFVAVAGEYVIASSRGDDSFKGSLYLFMKDRGGANNYGDKSKFTASSGAAGDTLGNGIGFAFPYFVSGAPGNDSAASGAGAGYVFELPIPMASDISAWEPVRQLIMD